jgi:hypothetical protein
MKTWGSRENTFRNGWGRTWPARSDESLVHLVGGTEERRLAAAVLEETKKREDGRKKRVGLGRTRAPHKRVRWVK